MLLTNAILVSFHPQPWVLHQGACWIDQGRIAAVGPESELAATVSEAVPRLDLGGRVLQPGLINCHNHLYSGLARGIALKDPSPSNFLEILQRLWWRLDQALTPQDCYLSALLGFGEAVSRGVTSVIDHHASPGCISGSLDQLSLARQQVGLRACLSYEVSNRHGVEGVQQGVEENLRFAERCSQDHSGLLSASLGLHASLTLDPDSLRLALKRWPHDVPIHVHLAEDGCDVEDSLLRYGLHPLRRLLREGLAERPLWAAHCIHLKAEELDLLAEHSIAVLHNPRSNLNNAVGRTPVVEMLARGVAVALGSDGMSQDMAEESRTLALIHKDQSLSWEQVRQITFTQPAQLASARFGRTLGRLEPGAEADLVVWDYDPPTPLTAANLMGHWLFGLASAPVFGTWVAGKCLFQAGKLTGIDPGSIKAQCRDAAQALWERW